MEDFILSHKLTKNEILNSDYYLGIANEIKDLKKASFIYRSQQETGEIIKDRFGAVQRCIDKNIYSKIDLMNRYGYQTIMDISNFISSFYRRKNRLKQRIQNIIIDGLIKTNNIYFATLTFKSLENTTDYTRRKYISRFLKKHCCHYVANIDFGESEEGTHREHYHAVISSPLGSEELQSLYCLGFSYFEPIRLSKKNPNGTFQRLAKYVSKLTNHAYKESTKRNCYIYDRNKDYVLQ